MVKKKIKEQNGMKRGKGEGETRLQKTTTITLCQQAPENIFQGSDIEHAP